MVNSAWSAANAAGAASSAAIAAQSSRRGMRHLPSSMDAPMINAVADPTSCGQCIAQQVLDFSAVAGAQQAWREQAQCAAITARQRIALAEDAIRKHAEILEADGDQERGEGRVARD